MVRNTPAWWFLVVAWLVTLVIATAYWWDNKPPLIEEPQVPVEIRGGTSVK